jgi:hypothetical protein
MALLITLLRSLQACHCIFFKEWLMVATLSKPLFANAASLARRAFVRAITIPVGDRIFADGIE